MSNATFIVMSSLFSLAFMILGAVWDVGLLLAIGIWFGFLNISGLIMWSDDHTLKVLLKELMEEVETGDDVG